MTNINPQSRKTQAGYQRTEGTFSLNMRFGLLALNAHQSVMSHLESACRRFSGMASRGEPAIRAGDKLLIYMNKTAAERARKSQKGKGKAAPAAAAPAAAGDVGANAEPLAPANNDGNDKGKGEGKKGKRKDGNKGKRSRGRG